MNIIYQTGASILRGVRQQDDFSYTVRETPLTNGGSTTPEVLSDSNVNHTIDSTTSNNFAIDVFDSTLAPGHSFINNTPTIVTCDAQGNVDRLINGSASIDIRTPVGTRNYQRVMSNGIVYDQKYWQSYIAGSLGKHIVDTMLGMISGKTPGYATMDMFTSNNYNYTTPSAIRNPNLFTGGLSLEPISIVNKNYATNTGVYIHPGLLISPRHIIGAAHFPAAGPIVWMDAAGGYHTASPVSSAVISGTDIVVQYLGAAVTGITPFKTLPANWLSYLPTADNKITLNLPCLTKIKHAQNQASRDVLGMNHFLFMHVAQSPSWYAYARTDSRIAALATEAWQAYVAGGSSGGPLFFVVNGELVLIGTYYSAITSQTIPSHLSAIEAAMNSLAVAQGDMTPYTFGTVNLSGFTVY